MGIEFLIKDKLSGELVLWSFVAYGEIFIDVYIEGKLTDTLIELGEINSYNDLSTKVMKQLAEWGVDWHSYAHTS